tara:strand:- start:109 stop:822 length:714 start_codon:yes stop_codon:yes gene_type:complete
MNVKIKDKVFTVTILEEAQAVVNEIPPDAKMPNEIEVMKANGEKMPIFNPLDAYADFLEKHGLVNAKQEPYNNYTQTKKYALGVKNLDQSTFQGQEAAKVAQAPGWEQGTGKKPRVYKYKMGDKTLFIKGNYWTDKSWKKSPDGDVNGISKEWKSYKNTDEFSNKWNELELDNMQEGTLEIYAVHRTLIYMKIKGVKVGGRKRRRRRKSKKRKSKKRRKSRKKKSRKRKRTRRRRRR